MISDLDWFMKLLNGIMMSPRDTAGDSVPLVHPDTPTWTDKSLDEVIKAAGGHCQVCKSLQFYIIHTY